MRLSILYGILLGGIFTVLFLLAGRPLTAVFLHEEDLIDQAGYFLKVLCLSAPTLGVINMVTSYFQALGKALHSLSITVMRNAVLFIPAVILLNHSWGLTGVIAAQPMVEVLLTVICFVLYTLELRSEHKASPKEAFRPSPESISKKDTIYMLSRIAVLTIRDHISILSFKIRTKIYVAPRTRDRNSHLFSMTV